MPGLPLYPPLSGGLPPPQLGHRQKPLRCWGLSDALQIGIDPFFSDVDASLGLHD